MPQTHRVNTRALSPKPALINALGRCNFCQRSLGLSTFFQSSTGWQHGPWAWSAGRSWATWRARGCQQDPRCPLPLPPLPHTADVPLSHANTSGFYVQILIKSGRNLHPHCFFKSGFFPKFSGAKPLREMPVTPLSQRRGTGMHRAGNGRHKATSAPWTASHSLSLQLRLSEVTKSLMKWSQAAGPQQTHPKLCHKCYLRNCRWEYAFIKWPRPACVVPGSLCSPSFQQPGHTAPALCLQPWPGPEEGTSEKMREFASLAFLGCCFTRYQLTHCIWWNLDAKNLFLFPRRRGRLLALLEEGQPTSPTPCSKKLFCLWISGGNLQYSLRIYVEMVQQRKSARGGRARGSLPLLPPHGFRAALWRGCWQLRERAVCCRRVGDSRALTICEHLSDSWAFNTPLGWVRSVHAASCME